MLLLLLLLVSATSTATANDFVVAKPNCTDKCGNISIPYPFGTTSGCYFNDDRAFQVTCIDDSNLVFGDSMADGVAVLDISLEEGELRISMEPASDCYAKGSQGNITRDYTYQSLQAGSILSISHRKNKFTAVGCDAWTMIQGLQERPYGTGCMAMCYNISDVANGSCEGVGCCQTSIPRGIKNYNVTVHSFFNHHYVLHFNPCSYAFVVEESNFTFSTSYLSDPNFNETAFPVVLDWAIGDQSCRAENICRQNHSQCIDSQSHPENITAGYRCQCLDGYTGNPYLPPGCQDVDECADSKLNNCTQTQDCHNVEGSYTCSCREGYLQQGDGKGPEGCTKKDDHGTALWVKVIVGASIGVTTLLICSTWLYWLFQKRKDVKLREKCFRLNGGFLLQDHLSKYQGSKPKIFSADALEKATNNYNANNILGRGGFGTVFKGILSDNTPVAIKKSRLADQDQIDQFVNEMSVLFQVNHRHVVRLLGCCLETQVPLLVYEYVNNGTLFDHIHDKTKSSNFPWKTRLRIASETAHVLSHLHSGVSTPIIHRDVKTQNILLDGENYTTKVSDFGASRSIPLDQAELNTMVQGTLGYMDPEYFQTSQLTEKSDVYGFGVVVLELLTGQKALSYDRPGESRNLVMVFLRALQEDCLSEVLADECVKKEGEVEYQQVKEVANLARKCVRVKGEERPTMKEVAMELEGLRTMKVGKDHPWIGDKEEKGYLIEKPLIEMSSFDGESSSGYDSMKNHVTLHISHAR